MASVDVDDATFVRSIGRQLSVASAFALGTESRLAFDAVLAIAVGLLANLRLMQTPGVPAFQQDWVWPTSSATVRGWFELATLPWNWNGLGTPQIYPFADFFVSGAAVVAFAIGPKIVLLAFFTLTTAVAGFAMGALIRAVGVRSRAALSVGIVAYALSAVYYNKAAAGHTYYLIGYALVPVLCVQLLRLSETRWQLAASAIGLELSASFAQAQFVVFDAFAIGAYLLICRGRWRRDEYLAVGAGVLAAVVVHAYPIIALLAPQAGYALIHQHATLAGVASESVSVHDLLMQDGYPPGYFRSASSASPWIGYAALLSGILSFVGLIVAAVRTFGRSPGRRYRSDALALVASIYVAGALLTLGLSGPAGPLLTYAFVHISATSILKELYHAMVLVALGSAVGAATLVDMFCGATRAIAERTLGYALRFSIVATTALIAIAALPAATGSWLDFVGMRDATAFDAAAAVLSTRDTPQRFLTLPITTPIRSFDRPSGGGNDSDALRPWNTSTPYMAAPDPALAYLQTALVYGPETNLRYIFERYGIAAVLERETYVSTKAEQSGLPPAQAAQFATAAIDRRLRTLGIGLRTDVDSVRTLAPSTPYRGVLLAGAAPVAGGDDIALADRQLAGIDAARSPYTPVVYSVDMRGDRELVRRLDHAVGTATQTSDWTIDRRRFVDLSASVTGFDPKTDWTSIADSYAFDRWQNFSPSGGIYTQAASALILHATTAEPRYLALLVATQSSPRSIAATPRDMRAARSIPLRLLRKSSDDSQHFSWYVASRMMTSTDTVAVSFDTRAGGVAVASAAYLDADELRALDRPAAAYRPGGPTPKVSLAHASPSTLDGTIDNAGTRCSLTLLTNFDPRWTLAIDDIRELRHFRADGWANGWTTACGRRRFAVAYDGRPFELALRIGWTMLVLLTVNTIAFAAIERRRRRMAEARG